MPKAPPPTLPSSALKLGADFGYRWTGLALLDGENRVLACAVTEHRGDVSQTLQSRRENRAMRRRARSRRRLRDFRALLAEMEIPPQLDNPTAGKGGEIASHGNRLYALAQWRGWDWAELEELLLEEDDDGKPRQTETVRLADDYLKAQSPQPPLRGLRGTARRGERESPKDFERRLDERRRAAEAVASGETAPPEWLRHLELRESCLGELYALVRAARDAATDAVKNPDDEDIRRAAVEKSQAAEGLRGRLHNIENIGEWIDERLRIIFAEKWPEVSGDRRDRMRGRLLALLGLEDGRDAFQKGGLYRPHRNRHRDKAKEKLRKLLRRAGREEWFARAAAVLDRPYRRSKARSDNRRPGKCPARKPDGKRCGCNVPLRARPDVRELLFHIEARQMKVRPRDGDEFRNLSEDELRTLAECADFQAATMDDEREAAFFAELRPRREREENRGKREALRDIAAGKMPGRAAFCRAHLAEKRDLLKNGDTEGDRWAALHQMRVLGPEDAPPSLRCKVDAVCAAVLRMIKSIGADPAAVSRVAVESARFDIAALSAAEGRKLKKSDYGKKRTRAREDLAAEQNNLCAYCGETLRFGWTVDHAFPRAAGGGDAAKNRVAACAACNIEKWQFANLRLNSKTLAALRVRNPAKAKFLETAVRQKRALASAKMSAAQQTMTGGKILRGALARALFGDSEAAADLQRFPVLRAADAAMLRQRWFPNIHRQKRALRAPDFALRVEVEKTRETDAEWGDIHPDPRPPVPNFIRPADNGKILLAPQPGDEGRFRVPLKDDIQPLKILPATARKRNLAAWESVAGQEREIDLAAAGVRGLLSAVDGHSPTAPECPIEWRRDGGTLAVRDNRPGERRLAFSRELLVAVVPKTGDPVRRYHHAADAVVAAAAAGADWEKIVRMERDISRRTPRQQRQFWKIADSGRPRTPNGEPFPDQAPDNEDEFLLSKPAAKTGPRRAKTGRQPLALAKINGKQFLVQRVPLDRLPRADIQKNFPQPGAIVPAAKTVRDQLRKAWNDIQALPAERRAEAVNSDNDRREFISQQWFLALPRDHTLHPRRTRSVPVVKFQDPRVAFAVRRGTALHRFKREEDWGEVVPWQTPDGRDGFCRRRPKWYRNNLNPEWDDSPEKGFIPPPDGATLLPAFRRGMRVRCDEPGLWRIKELGVYAALLPASPQARRATESAPKHAKTEDLRLAGTAEAVPEWRPAAGDRVEWRKTPGVWKIKTAAVRIVLVADDPDSRRWMRKEGQRKKKYACLKRA